jgi:hypothetical protein
VDLREWAHDQECTVLRVVHFSLNDPMQPLDTLMVSPSLSPPPMAEFPGSGLFVKWFQDVKSGGVGEWVIVLVSGTQCLWDPPEKVFETPFRVVCPWDRKLEHPPSCPAPSVSEGHPFVLAPGLLNC